jgi:bacterioferritin-associated ferredoxin
MKLIQICPYCGQPGIRVKEDAVRFNIVNFKRKNKDSKARWNICINPVCECSYFSGKDIYGISDLRKPLFFKDNSDDVPICYCSGLTRGEIRDAVKNGCKTIKDIQKYTKKSTTGHCETRNPLGKCCRYVFLRTISKG